MQYVVQIRTSKNIKSWINIEKKVHLVIKFDQKAWLKPYIDMNKL